jgi:hypothetical protein
LLGIGSSHRLKHKDALLFQQVTPSQTFFSILLAPRICSYSVDLRPGSETKERLKCGRRRLATIVPKDKFIEVYLELGLAHTVVGASEPPLEVANGSIGKGDSGLRTFAKFRAERLMRVICSKPGPQRDPRNS